MDIAKKYSVVSGGFVWEILSGAKDKVTWYAVCLCKFHHLWVNTSLFIALTIRVHQM